MTSMVFHAKITGTIGCVAMCAWSALAAGFGVSSYVQDGLVAHFDGELNALDANGTPVHSTASDAWVNLVNGQPAIWDRTGKPSVGARYYHVDGTGCLFTNNLTGFTASLGTSGRFTLECTSELDAVSGSAHGVCFRIGGACMYYQSGYLTYTTKPQQCGKWVAATAGTIYTGAVVHDPQLTLDADLPLPYWDGAYYRSSTNSTYNSTYVLNDVIKLGGTASSSTLKGRIYCARLYNRQLTETEIAQNAMVDNFRFRAVRAMGTGGAVDWSALGWTKNDGSSIAAPGVAPTVWAVVANVETHVAASDAVTLRGLSLEDGATLAVDATASVEAKLLYVEGQPVARGVYTGEGGTAGTVVPWVSGTGIVCVAGSLDQEIPTGLAQVGADGWIDFGVPGTIGSAKVSNDRTFTNIDYADVAHLVFPPQPRIRLHDNVILGKGGLADAELDLTGLKQLMLVNPNDYPGDTITVPEGARFRQIPGSVTGTDVENKWKWTPATATAIQKDVVLDGTWYSCSDYARDPNFAGKLSGSGLLTTDNFSRQVTLSGEQAFNGTFTFTGGSCGSCLIVKSTRITGTIKSVNLSGTSPTSEWHTNSSYYCSYVRFMPSAPTTDALKFDQFPTQAGGFGWKDTLKKFWRHGPALFFWGGNHVHINKLTGSSCLHVVADTSLNRTSRAQTGNAYLEIDQISGSSTLYPSTNVFITVGKVDTSAAFDYACESNAVNEATLDITNSCATTAKVVAQDLAMLPARLSGFAGSVTLTKTDARTYTMPVDLTQGTNALYNTVGCIGSGTLAAAPETGTIDVVFPTTGAQPVAGEYALARFASGGEKLANWTVRLNGTSVSEVTFLGMKVGVKKDSTGLWLKVERPGVLVIFR